MPNEVKPYDHDHENEVQLFAATNHRNRMVRFGIKTDDRRRHVYVIGKSGMGKTTLLENMILSDVYAGHGCCYIDPHGDTADKILDFIPPHRINDVIYFNPADVDFPVGFNILESIDPAKKHLVAGGLMAVFKKIWPDVWSARMEYILINTILALLDVPGATLLGINRMYTDDDYLKRVVSLIQDPVVKTFWTKEYASWEMKYKTEAVAPVQNKVGQFLSASIIRNIVAQTKSTIDLREIMDQRKILIVNLSKGLLGEENASLLGAMMITRLQLAAMERVNILERDRQDFYLYVDEFQNFATDSFATILSEARKYRLALVVAHQYIEQLSEEVSAAIFGNIGTMITFRVGGPDAEKLEGEFAPYFTQEDLIGLSKYDIYLRLLIDGVASQPFSAKTLPPIAQRTGSHEKVIRVSRERNASERLKIEKNVNKWAGYGGESADEETEEAPNVEEAAMETKLKELAASSPYVGEMAQPPAKGFGKGKKSETKHEVPCSVCGEIQKLTFDPDWSKPWFCKNHLEMRNSPMAHKLPTIAQLTGHEVPDRKKKIDDVVSAAKPVVSSEQVPSRSSAAPAAPALQKARITVTTSNSSDTAAHELRSAVVGETQAKVTTPRIIPEVKSASSPVHQPVAVQVSKVVIPESTDSVTPQLAVPIAARAVTPPPAKELLAEKKVPGALPKPVSVASPKPLNNIVRQQSRTPAPIRPETKIDKPQRDDRPPRRPEPQMAKARIVITTGGAPDTAASELLSAVVGEVKPKTEVPVPVGSVQTEVKQPASSVATNFDAKAVEARNEKITVEKIVHSEQVVDSTPVVVQKPDVSVPAVVEKASQPQSVSMTDAPVAVTPEVAPPVPQPEQDGVKPGGAVDSPIQANNVATPSDKPNQTWQPGQVIKF